jgi:hypothetical protein
MATWSGRSCLLGTLRARQTSTTLSTPAEHDAPLPGIPGVTLCAVGQESDQTGASGFQWWRDLPPWIQILIAGATLLLGLGTVLGVVHATGSPPRRGAVSASTTASATPAAVSGGIYHQGPLALAYNTGADLDALPSDPQWGEPSANRGGGGADLWSLYPDLAGINGAMVVTVDSGTGAACQNATGWLSANSFQDLNLGVGSFFCVRTSQGRYSLLNVTAIDPTSNKITFWVKTFKKAGD